MKRDNTPWGALPAAELDWQGSTDPVSARFGDVYYSRDNGLEESRHVFLRGNNLPGRWSQDTPSRFCIAETGFGTGLNFLLTWQAWRQLPQPRPQLHYVSIEKYPLRREDIGRALGSWPELAELTQVLLASYPGLLPGQHRLLLEDGNIRLDLWWEDVSDALRDLAELGRPLVDAWYLDGFAPSRNEAMWSAELMHDISRLSKSGATFATFTAAGHVRRSLAKSGFAVTKGPGYGRKRERLYGQLLEPVAASPVQSTPWDLVRTPLATPTKIMVIGAGLAGCTIAAALARRGLEVVLLDKGHVAGAGSGNEQGILYTRLSRRHSSLTDFALLSFRFATLYYQALFEQGKLQRHIDGDLCGSFHLSDKHDDMAYLRQVLAPLPELAQVLDAERASELLGVLPAGNGYWFPHSGWLRPASICRSLLDNPKITVLEHCGELQLAHESGAWQALANNQLMAEAPSAVLATGTSAATMAPLEWLPVQAVRGQTTQLKTTSQLSELRAALCHEGYIAPARQGSHCIGASFKLHDPGTDLRTREHNENLDKLAAAVPAWQQALRALDPKEMTGRAGQRCASPDYLPLVGPVPDRSDFLRDYAALRQNARQNIPLKGSYMPGLYLSTAHGSRGLTSTPLAAEILASQICAEPPPLSRELTRALAPARFLIRDLRRSRV